MGRTTRELTHDERTRECSFCGAEPGERCTNVRGGFYSAGSHLARRNPERYAARLARSAERADPDKRYSIILCGLCNHPGGANMLGQWRDGEWVDLGGACQCGTCPGWDDARTYRGHWSDRQSRELRTASRAP